MGSLALLSLADKSNIQSSESAESVARSALRGSYASVPMSLHSDHCAYELTLPLA